MSQSSSVADRVSDAQSSLSASFVRSTRQPRDSTLETFPLCFPSNNQSQVEQVAALEKTMSSATPLQPVAWLRSCVGPKWKGELGVWRGVNCQRATPSG